MTTHATRDSRYAVDFTMPEGTRVLAAREGVVVEAEWHRTAGADRGALREWGNVVRVRHEDGTIAIYGHLQHAGVAVEVGEGVWEGRGLGYSGSTGYSSAPHLHFGVTRVLDVAGLPVEESVPVTFYNGNPPQEFEPRVGLTLRASYAMPEGAPAVAETPAVARAVLYAPWPPRAPAPEPTPDALLQGWLRIGAMLVAGIIGMVWFYRFSRS